MGFRWPSWWGSTSLSPIVGAEVEESDGKLCVRCEREPWMGRLLNVGNRQLVCVDCFAFVTGIDDRDPIEDPTARSGDPRYVASSERDALVSASTAGDGSLTEDADPRPAPGKSERPLLAPLSKDEPWWVRLLHWLGVRGATMR